MHPALPTARPYPQVELRDVVAVSPKNGSFARRLAGRVVCGQRAFWLVDESTLSVRRIIHTDPRKERKF